MFGQCIYILVLIFLFSERYQWLWSDDTFSLKFLRNSTQYWAKNSKIIWKPFKIIWNQFDNKNSISANFDSSNFQLYMVVGTHLWHDDSKSNFHNLFIYCVSTKSSPKYFTSTKASKLTSSRWIWIQMSSHCNGKYI